MFNFLGKLIFYSVAGVATIAMMLLLAVWQLVKWCLYAFGAIVLVLALFAAMGGHVAWNGILIGAASVMLPAVIDGAFATWATHDNTRLI
jgi:O-antigen ligase